MYLFFFILGIFLFLKIFSKKFRQMRFNNINLFDNYSNQNYNLKIKKYN